MANDVSKLDNFDEEFSDDEMSRLFSAFDEVSAPDDLKDATLARILEQDSSAEDESLGAGSSSNEKLEPISSQPSASLDSTLPAREKGNVSEIRPVAKKGPSQVSRRAKWRAIRVAAIAACLTLALGGGIAYATPATYYDITQDNATITLGVNCFGITISATSDNEAGNELIASTDLRNIPYEESLTRAIEAMQKSEPDKSIEYGVQGGEHETVPSSGNVESPESHSDVADKHGEEGGVGEPSTGAPSTNANKETPQSSEANGKPQDGGNSDNRPPDSDAGRQPGADKELTAHP